MPHPMHRVENYAFFLEIFYAICGVHLGRPPLAPLSPLSPPPELIINELAPLAKWK